MERSVGLDRSYHRLPVLFVDDFAAITPELLREVRERMKREEGREEEGRERVGGRGEGREEGGREEREG